MSGRLMSSREVADYLSISTATVRNLARKGDLPAPVYITPHQPRWERAAVDHWIDQRLEVVPSYRDPDEALDELATKKA